MRLGIDIGGTKTAAALLDDAGRVTCLAVRPSGRGAHGVVAVALEAAREASAGVDLRGLTAVGACMPGLVDPVAGRVRHAVNLGVTELDLAARLATGLGVPVHVENDVKAAALGAYRWRRDTARTRRGEALAYLNLGTGLAAAIVRDGAVVRGIGGAAGEIGHLPVAGDVACPCGQRGCLETVASGSALARLWPDGAGQDPFAAAGWGDRQADAAVRALCRGVGLAVHVLVLAGGAEHVVVGGGLTALGEPLLEGIRRDLARRAADAPMLAALGLPDRVEVVPADVPVAALGAAHLDDGSVHVRDGAGLADLEEVP